MTIENSQNSQIPLLRGQLWKPSHRTLPEQLVGLGIFLSVHFAIEFLIGSFVSHSFQSPWFQSLAPASWILSSKTYFFCWSAYSFALSFSIWSLWRRYSLRVLRLEFSIFFSQILFQLAWSGVFFILHESLVALAALLFLWCNHLLSALLFWKKERISGQLLFLPFFWILYVMGLNMLICISNP